MAQARAGNGETFFESPSPSSTSSTPIEPLRINKRSSLASERRGSFSSSATATSPQIPHFPHPPIRRATGHFGTGTSGQQQNLYQHYADSRMAQQGQTPSPKPEGQQQQHPGGAPYTAQQFPPSPALAVDSQPARHVSVVHADSYPTPPAFRQREEGRPARLRSSSQSQLTAATPLTQQHYQPQLPQQAGSHGTPPPQQEYQYQPPAPGEPNLNPFPQYHQQYWPPGGPSRMTSTSTTMARRGSPPPPETPATATSEHPPVQLAGPRNGTPTQLNTAQSMAPPRRPWTPTESPDSYPHGPPTIWHGNSAQGSPPPDQPRRESHSQNAPEPVERDSNRRSMSSSPPPSYDSLGPTTGRSRGDSHASGTTAQGYPDEKRTVVVGAAAPVIPANESHPAFHNDPPAASTSPAQTSRPAHANTMQQGVSNPSAAHVPQQDVSTPSTAHFPQQPGAPPPMPEGWMAHLDQNSGQYYYIHVASAHTQWEPPAVDTMSPPPPPQPQPAPIQQEPNPQVAAVQGVHHAASPSTASVNMNYANQPPLGSPGFQPSTPGFPPSTPGFPPNTPGFPSGKAGFPPPESVFSQTSNSTLVGTPAPSVMGMPGPSTPGYGPGQFQPTPIPIPGAGIDQFKVTPVNGEYFGPYLRYTNMDLERGVWHGSILLVTEYGQAPTIHIHKSRDLSPNPRQLKGLPIYTHRTWSFFRYDIDLQMDEAGDMWTYAVSTPLGCTRYEFLVAGRYEKNWRFIAHSCNDFSIGVKGEERAKVGGHGFMWNDLMQKHLDCGGFHAQVGAGNQIYADRMWKELQPLREWAELKGKDNRKNAAWTTRADDEVMHAYFHYYTSSWDLPHLRESLAQIPYLFTLSDHDIFSGFGSYPEYLQFSQFFKNIGRIGTQWYLLFQHHTTLDMCHLQPTGPTDLFTITGTGWHFIKHLGPAVAVVGIDTRAERNPHQVLAGPTYQGIFPKIAALPASTQHALILLAVPIIYPRLESAEHIASTVATGKKAVTGTFNLLSRAASSTAGLIGAKEVVGSGLTHFKKSVGKHGLLSSSISVFGEVDLLDDLRDHWTHESKDLERTYLIRTLQGIAHARSLRITFLSGDTHTCGAGLFYDPNKPHDHKTMYQIITAGIVHPPPPAFIIRLLHSPHRPLYVPQNGTRASNAVSDTKEEMVELFQNEVDGRVREYRRVMGKRNYAIFTAFETGPGGMAHGGKGGDPGKEPSVSLAVDFIVQGEGVYTGTGKYGPVVVPRLEMGW